MNPDSRCPKRDSQSATSDVTWLLHRAAQRLRADLNVACRGMGLGDVRDWIVLVTLADGEDRTQLEIGQELGLDKTTLMSLLDRMENAGFIFRTISPSDRRVRIPRITDEGQRVRDEVARKRDEVEERMLSTVSESERTTFLAVLRNLAGCDDETTLHGSCM